MERDKLSLLKLKFYLFSSANAEQRQDQRYLPVEDKKGGSFPGPPTYASGLNNKIKPYDRNIKHEKLCKRLEQAKQSFKWKCDEEGEEKTCPEQEGPDRQFALPWSSPGEDDCPKEGEI